MCCFRAGEYLHKNCVGTQHLPELASLGQLETEWVLGMQEIELQDPFNVVLWLVNPQILL